jgi:hypothetical protein
MVADFLSIDPPTTETFDVSLEQFVGRYGDQAADSDAVYEVVAERDGLVLVGLRWFGERCRLVRRGPCSFVFESFPWEATFEIGERGTAEEMTLAGPDLLFRRSGPRVFRRITETATESA